jgi:hypothetical protein
MALTYFSENGMNTSAPADQEKRRTRFWWWLLLVSTLMGPFLPVFLAMSANPRGDGLALLLEGLVGWAVLVVVVASVTGWRVNSKRSTLVRVGMTVLFVLGAFAVAAGAGFGECSAAKSIWPWFPL